MCLSTVYIESDGHRQRIMQDVAHMVTADGGYRLIGLLGEQQFVSGKIAAVDFIDEHTVTIEQKDPSSCRD